MQRKLFLGIVFIFFISLFSFAQTPVSQSPARVWWYTLEQGKQYFRSGSYGDALIAFDNARRQRFEQFTLMEQDLILLLSKPEVRRLGDSLELVEKYIDYYHEDRAKAALAELYYRVPKDSLNGSAKQALEALGRLKSYPEAEYWLGESYLADGELTLALRQYERAWEKRDFLETPGFDIDILYKITDVHRMRRDYQNMEKRANEIIQGSGSGNASRDTLWASNGIRAAMARNLENEGIEHFLVLYRYDNPLTEKAHRLLGFFCYASNRYSLAAEHLTFAFLIQNSVLIDEATRHEYDFNFIPLENLMNYVRSKPKLAAYAEETEYFKTVYYLATSLYATGKTKPASQLWAFLAASKDAGEWGARARRYPAPFVDRAIEMP